MYAEKFPKDYQSYLNIGNFYDKNADFGNAKKYYEKAYLLEPSNVNISSKLARIEFYLGNFDTALKGYNETLAISKTAKDSAEAYASISSYYGARGEFDLSIEYFEKLQHLRQKFMAPIQVIFNKCFAAPSYISAGKTDDIFNFLDKSKAELSPPLDGVTAFGYMLAYTELNDDKNAEKQISIAEDFVKSFGEESLLANIYYTWGRIYEIRGDYEKSIENFNLFFDLQPTLHRVNRDVCRVYRKMEQYDKAEENILLALKHTPYSGKANYEAALLYSEMGENEKAHDHLIIANKVWEDADPGYKEANEARAKLAELEAGS
jgi:tetratricopeptide (TPR) repeat protein